MSRLHLLNKVSPNTIFARSGKQQKSPSAIPIDIEINEAPEIPAENNLPEDEGESSIEPNTESPEPEATDFTDLEVAEISGEEAEWDPLATEKTEVEAVLEDLPTDSSSLTSEQLPVNSQEDETTAETTEITTKKAETFSEVDSSLEISSEESGEEIEVVDAEEDSTLDSESIDPVAENESESELEDEAIVALANDIKAEIESTESTESTETTDESEEEEFAPVETIQNSEFTSGVFTVGDTGEVTVDFLFDGGGYQGELAVFSLDAMEEFELGSEEFIQEAASRALSNTTLGHIIISDPTEGAKFTGELGEGDSNSGEYLGTKTFILRPGDKFGFMLVPNGQVQQIYSDPSAGGALRPLFSMATANPNDTFHLGQIADVTGNGNTFVMEDLRVDTGSDRDYNDLIFQIRGATGTAVSLDDVIDPAKDWRTSDLGQALVDYALETSEVDSQVVDAIGEITTAISTDLAPELQGMLEQLQSTLTGITTNPAITLEPSPDAPTAEQQDQIIAQLNAEIEAAFAELANSEYVDVNTLAGKFNFPRENQPLLGVIDTGFLANNPDIDSSRIILGQDYIDNDNNPLFSADTEDNHGTKILEIIAATQNNSVGFDGVNDDAPLWLGRAVGSGEWSESLVEFVDAVKQSGQPNGLINLSFDLTQQNSDGSITTRTQFTQAEIDALRYARDHDVLIIAAAGNQGTDILSALGQASEHFDNIVTVGAADEAANRADYSSYGRGLDLLAYGWQTDDPTIATGNLSPDLFASLTSQEAQLVEKLMKQSDSSGNESLSLSEEKQAFAATQKLLAQTLSSFDQVGRNGDTELGQMGIAGTSIAAAKVTGAASQVWAANPNLSAAQIKEILKDTAIDLDTPGWDLETGAGLLNMGLAVQLGLVTKAEAYTASSDPLFPALGTLDSSATPQERPAFLKKVWREVKRVFKQVITFVEKVVSVVERVVNLVGKVVDVITKAIPLFNKIGGFISSIASKFICLPILGKIGIVLGGIALVGAAVAGAIFAFRKPKTTDQQQVVVVQKDPQQILDLEAAWKLLTPQQQNAIGPALKQGLDPKYLPLFDGTDPDGIIPILSTLSSLSPQQQQDLSGYLVDGVPSLWQTFFNGTDPNNPFVPTSVKNSWSSLSPAQQNVLQPLLLNGTTSSYGRPLLNGDPDGVVDILGVLGSTALNDTQRSLMASFLFTPGGIPPEYENRF